MSKQFTLKPIETQVLLVEQQLFQSSISNIISMIAVERLGYEVTQNTKFNLSDDLKTLTISEDEEGVVVPEPEVA